MPCIWKPEGKCSYRYGATPHNKGAFTYPRFMPCIWKPEGKCSYRYGATTQNKGDAITDMVPLTKQMGAYPIKINTMHI